jgi:hypothetical protein
VKGLNGFLSPRGPDAALYRVSHRLAADAAKLDADGHGVAGLKRGRDAGSQWQIESWQPIEFDFLMPNAHRDSVSSSKPARLARAAGSAPLPQVYPLEIAQGESYDNSSGLQVC